MMHFREVRAHPFIHDLDLIQSFSSVSASPLTTKISQIQVTADLLLGKPSSTLPKISLDSCPAVFPQLTMVERRVQLKFASCQTFSPLLQIIESW